LQTISVDEILNYKVLPFDIFVASGKKLFSSGEVLTPGKILQLKYIPAIYIEEIQDNEEFVEIAEEDDNFEVLEDLKKFEKDDFANFGDVDEFSVEDEFLDEDEYKDESVGEQKIKSVCPKFLSDYTAENVLKDVQKDIKSKYKEMMDAFMEEGAKDPSLCIDIRDTIIEEVIPEINRIFYKSQLKVYGDYNYAHGVNVAMFSAMLAYKLRYNDQAVKDITLAAMLHDIGKTEIPNAVLNKSTHNSSEARLIQLHTKLGYSIIKNELGLSENVARVALQHHERPDGSGYPYGLSDKLISPETHIVTLCDEFDKLTSGRGLIKVRNYKDAIKHLLETGTKHFKSDILYTFVYMTNYNDMAPITVEMYR